MMPDPFNQMRKAIFFLMILSILILTAFNNARSAADNTSPSQLELQQHDGS